MKAVNEKRILITRSVNKTHIKTHLTICLPISIIIVLLNRLSATRLCCFPVQTCQGALFRLSYSPSKNAKRRDSTCLIFRLIIFASKC